jgi:transposase
MRKARSPAELGFTGHDRRRLAAALHQAQEAKVYQRVQAVLLIAQGYSVDEVARIIRGQQRSVYYWVHRYLDHHRVTDLYDASRTGRPRTAAQITKAHILRELARDPLKLGYSTTIWTVPLLASHLSQRYDAQITPRTLRRRMKEVGLRWKRPRYVYVAKDPHRVQKKGRSSDV